MKSSKKQWGALTISSVADAMTELRRGLNIPVKTLTDALGVTRTTIHRYESGELPPLSVLLFFLRLALSKNAPSVIVRAFSTDLAEEFNAPEFAVLLFALSALEGPDAPRHVAKHAKRALEILEAE